MNEPSTNQLKTCGACALWVKRGPGDNEKGECHRYPPTVLGKEFQVRPCMKHNEPGCGEHVALAAGQRPAEKVKPQLPTHGELMRDARQRAS